MTPPLTSTYRLQLHAGFTFDDARRVVPYLARLGVSHVYLSPVLAARPGSTHGYDVVDPRAANPELGGDDGFAALARDVHAQGLGLVVDIVPNHMGIGAANPFWMDVLRRGRDSRFAGVFDIDWDAPGANGRVVLPVLGDDVDALVARGELRLSTASGEPRVTYYEHEWPLDPESDPRDPLGTLLGAQHWRVAHWKRAARELNYRRFFDVGELAALRVEDPDVFELTHRWTLDRVADGSIDGLRIDHVDGLRDPLGYLERLRAEVDARRPGERLPLFVEKILSPGERLPATWPVAGTTGYEAMHALDDAFISASGYGAIERAYRRLLRVGADIGFDDVAHRGKELVLRRAFDADVRRLVRLLGPVVRAVAPRIPRPLIHEAIVQLAISLPVYRTYARRMPDGSLDVGADDARWIGDALARVLRGGSDRYAAILIADVLRAEWPGAAPVPSRAGVAAHEFALRFPQLSGPATAKGIEDTAMYRWFPLASRSEVGGDPGAPLEGAVAALHAANAERRRDWPTALTTIDTHDAKRSADVRSRLHALAELPDEWTALVARWRRRHVALRTLVDRRAAPDANVEYLLYQTVVALWPVSDVERVTTYLRKAAREAKAQTSWVDADAEYERALDGFVAALLQGDAGADFRADVAHLAGRVSRAATWTSLARLVLHLAAPGTPDTYQGGELWRLAVVDPDNRRPVDFARRAALLDAPVDLAAAVAAPDDGRLKLHVLTTLLRERRAAPTLYVDGAYLPLAVRGARAEHVVAFARISGERGAVVIVPRLPLGLHADGRAPIGDVWQDTTVHLPSDAARLTNLIDGAGVASSRGAIAVAHALATVPVACLRW